MILKELVATNDGGRSQLRLSSVADMNVDWLAVIGLEEIAEVGPLTPRLIVLRNFDFGEVGAVCERALACLTHNTADPLDQSKIPDLRVL